VLSFEKIYQDIRERALAYERTVRIWEPSTVLRALENQGDGHMHSQHNGGQRAMDFCRIDKGQRVAKDTNVVGFVGGPKEKEVRMEKGRTNTHRQAKRQER
jgi:hypothetical protein